MQPISRRVFLAGSVAVVVGACSSDSKVASPETTAAAPTSPSTSSAPATDAPTTAAAQTVPPTTAETVPPTEPDTVPTTTTPATTTEPPVELPGDPFTLGVASGDPAVGSVVLWTRLAPDPLAGGGMSADDIDVVWELSRTEDFAEIELEGIEVATADFGHSVHAHVAAGAGDWFYRFRAGGFTSPVGLTRTAPDASTPTETLRFASASCQNYEDGFYTAHRDLADQRPDFAVFLGDYIYEGGAGEIGVDDNVRTHGSPEIMTLDDYRNRYALYKGDPDLQAAHAACPWFVIWDDHEVENNYAGMIPQDPADAAIFAERRRIAYQAWWEHQPVGLAPPSPTTDLQIYRSAEWGGLLTLALLDTRQYRSDQACGDGSLSLDPACPETFDPARTMLGDEQEAWLLEQLTSSTAVWRTIGQQVVFGNVMLEDAVLNYDQWDGYPVQRDRIVQHLADNAVPNVVVLTGDIHFSAVGTIRAGDREAGTPVAVELVATSISSGGSIDPAVTEVLRQFPFVLDAELLHRGYILHTVTADRWSAEYRMVDTVKEVGAPMFVYNTYTIDAGTNTAQFAAAA